MHQGDEPLSDVRFVGISEDHHPEMLVEAKKHIPSAILWQVIVGCNPTIDEC